MALKGFSQIQQSSSSSSGERDKFPKLDFADKDGEATIIRAVGPIYPMGQHWIERKTNDGTKKKFPRPCANYDPKTDTFKNNGCPWCAEELSFNRRYYTNVIDREEVDNEPKRIPEHIKSEKKLNQAEGFDFEVKFKSPESKSWTPVKVTSFPVGVGRDIGALEKTKNTKVSKKTGKKITFAMGHSKYGFDASVLYDGSRKSKAWSVEFSETTELTDVEKDYLYHDLSTSQWLKPVDVEVEIAEFEKIKDVIIYPTKDGDESITKKKKPSLDLDDDSDEDEIPVKKNKSRVEEDDEDDNVSNDYDDDETPVKKKKSRVVEEDEEDDELEF